MIQQSISAPSNINWVRHAEELVRGCVTMYAKAADDPALQRQSLQRTLHALSDDVVRNLTAELEATRLYANYAYHHANGFFVLFLTDPEIGFQVRLHIWIPHVEAPQEHPHRHRMSFASRVLSGVLTSFHYEVLARGPQVAEKDRQPGTGIFHEAVINAPARSDFDYPVAEVSIRDTVALGHRTTSSYRRGDTYFFQASDIHCVRTPANLEKPIITLTIWEPPFQESIAYEPAGPSSEGRMGDVAVKRLELNNYKRLLRMVRDSCNPAE